MDNAGWDLIRWRDELATDTLWVAADWAGYYDTTEDGKMSSYREQQEIIKRLKETIADAQTRHVKELAEARATIARLKERLEQAEQKRDIYEKWGKEWKETAEQAESQVAVLLAYSDLHFDWHVECAGNAACGEAEPGVPCVSPRYQLSTVAKRLVEERDRYRKAPLLSAWVRDSKLLLAEVERLEARIKELEEKLSRSEMERRYAEDAHATLQPLHVEAKKRIERLLAAGNALAEALAILVPDHLHPDTPLAAWTAEVGNE